MESPERPRPGQAAMERFVKDEIARRYRSLRRFIKQTGYPTTTFYRVVGDSPVAKPDQFRHLEGALDLPRYMLDWLAEGQPENMGSDYERAVWKVYFLSITDEMRRNALSALQAKHDAAQNWGEDDQAQTS